MLISLTPISILVFNYSSQQDGVMNIEKSETVEFPKPFDENGINEGFDNECEAWFNQNIPFRGEVISKINFVLSDFLKIPTSNVVPGKDGWIYSAETIDDYMDTDAMSKEEIKALGVSLSLMQEKVEAHNGRFLFVPVPNKNSIYFEYMPARYKKSNDNNLTRLYEELDKEKIPYANLQKKLLSEKEKMSAERLYYKRDTHWTSLGAVIGYEEIIKELGRTSCLNATPTYIVSKTKMGDLDKLLYPKENKYDDDYIMDENIDYDSFEFVNPAGLDDTKAGLENFMSDREDHDNDFTTRKKEPNGNTALYMIRDSFTRALLPYMIDSYDEARFVRSSSPYFEKLTKGSDVVYEICERNIKNIIESAPVMYAPIRKDHKTKVYRSELNNCTCKDDGYAYKISGKIDPEMVDDDGRIYARLEDEHTNTILFEAFPICDDGYGFSAYLDKNVLGDQNYTIKIVSGDYESDIVANIPTDCVTVDNADETIKSAVNPYKKENKKHQIVLRGVKIGIGDNINSLKRELGDQTEPTEKIYSCLTGGDVQLYHYPNISIEADMNGVIHYISLMEDGISDEEDAAATESGIAIGSDKMDIWKKLGNPIKENDKNCIFRTEHIKVTYSYKAGIVTSIILEECDKAIDIDDIVEDESQKNPDTEYENGNTYLYDEDDEMKTGWQIVNDEYYFFDRETGERIVGQTVDGIKIGPAGETDLSDYDKKKIDTMIKARKVVLENTKPTDTIEEKRKKLFDWVLSFPYHQYRYLKDVYKKQGIEIIEANDIFDKGAGDCVSESAALAFLFHEIGYNDVYWVHDTGHSWVRCEDKLFDPLFAEAKDYNANYNAPFTDYRISMDHSLLIY